MLRHRMAVSNWLRSSLGIARLIGYHSAETGPAITATTSSGEIVATVSTDSLRLGAMFDVTARLGGGVVAFIAVSVIMLNASLPLGLTVVIGVPAVGLVLALLLRPLRTRQAVWREEAGGLTTLGADTVVGLRVLRGIGGEQEFVERYAAQSQRVRAAGVGVAKTQSWLDGLQVLLPGVFLVFIVWFGAHLALDGEITPGQLTAFYGYATFLVLPLRTAVEAAQTFTAGVVSARRVLSVLRTQPAARDAAPTADAPAWGSAIEDLASGVVIQPGRFTAIVDAESRRGSRDRDAAGDGSTTPSTRRRRCSGAGSTTPGCPSGRCASASSSTTPTRTSSADACSTGSTPSRSATRTPRRAACAASPRPSTPPPRPRRWMRCPRACTKASPSAGAPSPAASASASASRAPCSRTRRSSC